MNHYCFDELSGLHILQDKYLSNLILSLYCIGLQIFANLEFLGSIPINMQACGQKDSSYNKTPLMPHTNLYKCIK